MFLKRLIDTSDSFAPMLARVVLGGVMLPHGLMKFGFFGGRSLETNLAYLTGSAGLPLPLAWLVIAIETLGALALVLGLFARPAALGMAAVMIGAALTEHTKHGFFMNWVGGAPAGAEGFEYHLLTLGMSLPLLITGAGALSVDRWLASRSPATRTVLDPQPV